MNHVPSGMLGFGVGRGNDDVDHQFDDFPPAYLAPSLSFFVVRGLGSTFKLYHCCFLFLLNLELLIHSG